MPELPEVETMVRGIRPHVEGRTIAALRRCRCRCRPVAISPSWRQVRERCAGQRIDTVRRVAKRVVLDLASGDALVIEPRMTGLMLLADPPDREHLRLVWEFLENGEEPALWFWDRRGLGTVRLYDAQELAEALGPNRLGPDAPALTAAAWQRRCAATRRPIKVALLDQKFAAGIGNLYASEILHAAGIAPQRPADSLSSREIRRLHRAVGRILRAAIRSEGSTLSDGTYRNALNGSGSFQNQHRVYQKAGLPCPGCRRESIRRVVQAQRSTFYCPACQR